MSGAGEDEYVNVMRFVIVTTTATSRHRLPKPVSISQGFRDVLASFNSSIKLDRTMWAKEAAGTACWHEAMETLESTGASSILLTPRWRFRARSTSTPGTYAGAMEAVPEEAVPEEAVPRFKKTPRYSQMPETQVVTQVRRRPTFSPAAAPRFRPSSANCRRHRSLPSCRWSCNTSCTLSSTCGVPTDAFPPSLCRACTTA